jgi:hypothetical protein
MAKEDAALLRVFLLRTRVAKELKKTVDVSPLELSVLAFIDVCPVGVTRRRIMDAKLGTERKVQDAVKSVVDKGMCVHQQLSPRMARKLRLTDKGQGVVNALLIEMKRAMRKLDRG